MLVVCQKSVPEEADHHIQLQEQANDPVIGPGEHGIGASRGSQSLCDSLPSQNERLVIILNLIKSK